MSEMIQYRASRIDVREMEDSGAMLLARTDKGQLVEGYEVRQGAGRKNAVLTLVERSGSARSFGAKTAKKQDVLPIVRANIPHEDDVTTDEAVQYAKLCDEFAKHGSVDHHRSEYGRRIINTKSVNGRYGILERSMIGVYQHCAEQRSPR